VGDLAAIRVAIDDEPIVNIVLSALPPSWETFATVIAGSKSTPTFTDLETLITIEETCQTKNYASEEELLATAIENLAINHYGLNHCFLEHPSAKVLALGKDAEVVEAVALYVDAIVPGKYNFQSLPHLPTAILEVI
jgi:hypothetical protein